MACKLLCIISRCGTRWLTTGGYHAKGETIKGLELELDVWHVKDQECLIGSHHRYHLSDLNCFLLRKIVLKFITVIEVIASLVVSGMRNQLLRLRGKHIMEEGEAYQGGFSIRTRSEKVGVIMRQEMLISCILICMYIRRKDLRLHIAITFTQA